MNKLKMDSQDFVFKDVFTVSQKKLRVQVYSDQQCRESWCVGVTLTHALMSSQLDPGALPPQRPVHHGQVGFPGATLRHKRKQIMLLPAS